MLTSTVQGGAFRLGLPVARYVFSGRSITSSASFVPLRNKYKNPVLFDKTDRARYLPDTVPGASVMEADERNGVLSRKDKKIGALLSVKLEQVNRNSLGNSQLSMQVARILPGVLAEKFSFSHLDQGEKRFPKSVSVFSERKRALVSQRSFELVSAVMQPPKKEAKRLMPSPKGQVTRNIIPYPNRKIFPVSQENTRLNFGGHGHAPIGSSRGLALEKSMAPPPGIRNKSLENAMQEKNSLHQVGKEDISHGDFKTQFSSFRTELSVRHDPEKNSRISARQGHGGVDELRFPQYPGRSIGIN